MKYDLVLHIEVESVIIVVIFKKNKNFNVYMSETAQCRLSFAIVQERGCVDYMNIAVIFTGGTIGSTIAKSGFITPDQRFPYKLLDLYEQKFGMEKNVKFEVSEPFQILSENMCVENVNLLVNCVKEILEEQKIKKHYDGIIITHGTDTLQYTAAILSYVFERTEIPIILVSSDYPPEDVRANALPNLRGAVTFIKELFSEVDGSQEQRNKPAGVFVSYENKGENLKIHRGSRLLQHMAYSASVYSVCNQFYGEIKDNLFIKNPLYQVLSSEIPIKKCYNNKDWLKLTDQNILRIDPYVGMKYPCSLAGVKAVLHESFHSGTIRISGETVAFGELAKKAGVPVFVTGVPGDEAVYETVGEYNRIGFQVLPVMSPIAAYCKLWLACNNGWNVEETMKSCMSEDCIL
jgi:L-asparaginase